MAKSPPSFGTQDLHRKGIPKGFPLPTLETVDVNVIGVRRPPLHILKSKVKGFRIQGPNIFESKPSNGLPEPRALKSKGFGICNLKHDGFVW